MTFLDVGYADAVFIKLPSSELMLIDAGEDEKAENILRFLSKNKQQTIDFGIITHPHKNHFKGFFGIIPRFKIRKVFINGDKNAEEGYTEILNLLRKRDIPIKILHAGNGIETKSPNVRIDVLHPKRLAGDVNDNSLVLRIRYKKVTLIFTADIGVKVQDKIFSDFAESVDVISVPHHGFGVSEVFCKKFKDAVKVISTGPNREGLSLTEKEILKLGNNIYRTDKLGAVTIVTDGVSLKINTERN